MKGKGKTRPKSTDKQKPQKKQEHQEPQADNQTQGKKEEKHQFSLYDLLEVAKEASADEIKKQYRKLVLQYHPDKNKDDPSAREKFQKLKEAYDILIDPQKRKQYDQTGRIGDQFDQQNFVAAYNYFRNLYKKVTPQDIKSFEQRYRFGQMEKEDLINFYNQHSGDMTLLLQCIPLSGNDDIPRFIKFFEEEIAKKTIEKYKIFDNTKVKVRLLKDESEQFEKEKQKDMGALVAAIQGRSNKQKDFLAELQAKYGGKKKADPKLRKKKE